MLSNARVMSFLATTDADRAAHFFGEVLGLTLRERDEFALVFECRDTLLRISPLRQMVVAPYTVFGWQVDDIRSDVQGLIGKGIVFERFEGIPVDDNGICTFPNGDQVAWFKDPDGNLLSLAQIVAG